MPAAARLRVRLTLAGAVVALGLGIAHAASVHPPPTTIPAGLGSAAGRPLPSGFLGLSVEYPALLRYSGRDPALFAQLIRNLAPGQRPVLRIGGDSTDDTWWPVPGMTRPAGVVDTLGPAWLAVARSVVRASGARLLLGINLEADSVPLAATELQQLAAGFARGTVLGFELGNEPSLYGLFPWYRTASGRGVPGRDRHYGFAAYLADFHRIAAGLPQGPLAGPSSGGSGWWSQLGRFLSAEPAVRLVTVHHYPLQLCYTPPGSPGYPTIAHLLSAAGTTGFASAFAAPAALAHRRGLPARIDELGTVSCGADPAVSQTFASALWAVQTLFALDRAGIDGVQMHTFPGAGYELFPMSRRDGHLVAAIAPEYYGLLLFAAAAPAGSRLVPVTLSGAPASVHGWATRAPDGRLRVVFVNTGDRRVTVALRAPGAGPATLERLTAPALATRTGVSLGGRSFGAATATGRLPAAARRTLVAPRSGRYEVTVPGPSAVLLTFPAS
jgi:hypothetical protein